MILVPWEKGGGEIVGEIGSTCENLFRIGTIPDVIGFIEDESEAGIGSGLGSEERDEIDDERESEIGDRTRLLVK